MRYITEKKTIAVVITLLFLTISCIPYTYAKISNTQLIKIDGIKTNFISSNWEIDQYNVDYKEILVSKYNSDGSIEKNIVKIQIDQFEKFLDELYAKNNLKDKFEIYKKYNLISNEMTFEKLEMDMQNNEKYFGSNQNIINKIKKFASFLNNFNEVIMSSNLQCEVYGIINYGMKYLIGMSAITSFINFIIWHKFHYIPSIDLLDFYAADWGKLDAINGTMADFHTEYGFLLIIMVGFVGYTFAYPPIPGNILIGEFFGKALFVMCQH